MTAPTLKKLTPCPLEIFYLYTEESVIRFDKTAVERIHVNVYSRDMLTWYFGAPVPTEEAREIYRGLLERGAKRSRRDDKYLPRSNRS